MLCSLALSSFRNFESTREWDRVLAQRTANIGCVPRGFRLGKRRAESTSLPDSARQAPPMTRSLPVLAVSESGSDISGPEMDVDNNDGKSTTEAEHTEGSEDEFATSSDVDVNGDAKRAPVGTRESAIAKPVRRIHKDADPQRRKSDRSASESKVNADALISAFRSQSEAKAYGKDVTDHFTEVLAAVQRDNKKLLNTVRSEQDARENAEHMLAKKELEISALNANMTQKLHRIERETERLLTRKVRLGGIFSRSDMCRV